MRNGPVSFRSRGVAKAIGICAALSMLPLIGPASAEEGSRTPPDWDSQISAAFLDEDGGLRSKEEVEANWGDLTGDQRARLLSDCQQALALNSVGPTAFGFAGSDPMEMDGMRTSSIGAKTMLNPPLEAKPSISSGDDDRLSLLCSWLPDL